MKREIIVADNCPTCDRLIDFVTTKKIDCKIINISRNKSLRKKDVLVVPALFVDSKLIAYGEDIYLKIAS